MSGPHGVLPLAAAAGLPAALLGFLAGLAFDSTALALGLTGALAGGFALAIARERAAPRPVAIAAFFLALFSASLFFLWGASTAGN